ncbi:MAG: dihydroneopterin aldolase [Candidatus Dadabacteria bacterium]|nr:dihydroneopterin aldolase [Candidatus Dadabacteria bacterium]MCY4043399.1 dihydroneopterin aldolase [Candidatus Dadabacteria bacterium]MCY4047198.1 dihydroneopterin aldolase [Candidatus Dadabacteria bacterium]
MTVISIENLRLRTVVGIFEWEKKILQEVVVNVEARIDCPDPLAIGDDISGTLDYKALNKKIIRFVEDGRFNLLETIAGGIARIVLEDDKALEATVRVDKPGALRFADSVSVTHTAQRRGEDG